MEGSLFFFFFSKFRERKKEPGINHRDEHSVYAKIEHLENLNRVGEETEWRCEF